MNAKSNQGRVYKRVIYTLCIAVLLLAVFFLVLQYTYKDTEHDGFEELRIQAEQIKEDLSLQMFSDQENLLTMSRLAASLHVNQPEEDSYALLLQSFESIGLIDHIALLTPDNMLHTRTGEIDVRDSLDFAEEARRGQYISGRIQDVSHPEMQIIRCSVPVVSDGETVAILYGAVALESLLEKYSGYINAVDTELFLVERSSGNFILDTLHDELGNINELQNRKSKKGYSYEKMLNDVEDGESGFTAFKSAVDGEYLYMYYAPVGIDDWQILLARTEDVLFAEAQKLGVMLIFFFLVVIAIMALYVVLIFNSERRQTAVFINASRTRKLLLEINQRGDSIGAALEGIALFVNAQSAFYVDTEGEDYSFTQPSFRDALLQENDRKYFISFLMEYAQKQRKDRRYAATIMEVKANAALQEAHAEFYDFLKAHRINSVVMASIENKKDENTSILGIINPRRHSDAKGLLREITVCFSMAIYNRKYLSRTEAIAVTDSLTGLCNRLAYKRMLAAFDERMAEQFSCIYVDVNELHIINNKYGHAVGDEMLLFVASTLQKVFPGGYIYRMGGDEFLVFNEGMPREEVVNGVARLQELCEAQKYHISIGMDFRSKNIDTEAVVKEAEKRMYEAKAEFYQQRRQNTSFDGESVPAEHSYIGIYCVSFRTDTAYSILMSGYFKRFVDHEDSFSKALFSYMHELVQPDCHRAMLNSLKYDVLKKQLCEGRVPSVAYTKTTGERVVVSVYAVPEQDEIEETIWTFERDNSPLEML